MKEKVRIFAGCSVSQTPKEKRKGGSMYRKMIKRILDILISVLILIFFCWLYLILGIMVRIKLGTPVLFRQERPGRGGKIFKLYKFRSMTDQRDSRGELLDDASRLPKFGRMLRATSLDELPEMINILKGDMSFVGPRPLLVRYLPYYTEEELHRHDVRPGLTGLAQVNGRNALDWEERFRYDLEYVHHCTLGMDLKIVGMTIGKVVYQTGVQSGAEQTVPDFDVYRKSQGYTPKR